VQLRVWPPHPQRDCSTLTTAQVEDTSAEVKAGSPLSPTEKSRLEQHIKGRPDQQELVERNILKGSYLSKDPTSDSLNTDLIEPGVAPALVAAREKLQKSQLAVRHALDEQVAVLTVGQDKLDNELQTRPTPEELVKRGILNGESINL
jgi:hypothetical protein